MYCISIKFNFVKHTAGARSRGRNYFPLARGHAKPRDKGTNNTLQRWERRMNFVSRVREELTNFKASKDRLLLGAPQAEVLMFCCYFVR